MLASVLYIWRITAYFNQYTKAEASMEKAKHKCNSSYTKI